MKKYNIFIKKYTLPPVHICTSCNGNFRHVIYVNGKTMCQWCYNARYADDFKNQY